MGAKISHVVCEKCGREEDVESSFRCCGANETIPVYIRGRQLTFDPDWHIDGKFSVNRLTRHYSIRCKKCNKTTAWYGSEKGPRVSCCVLWGKIPPVHYDNYSWLDWDGEKFTVTSRQEIKYMPPKWKPRDYYVPQPIPAGGPRFSPDPEPVWYTCPGCPTQISYKGVCMECRRRCKICRRDIYNDDLSKCYICKHEHEGVCGAEITFDHQTPITRTVAHETYNWGTRVDPYGGQSYQYGPERSMRYETEGGTRTEKITARCPCSGAPHTCVEIVWVD